MHERFEEAQPVSCAPRGVAVIGAEKAEQLRLPSADIQVMELSTKTPRRSTVYYAEPANQQAALAGFLGARGTARRILSERNFGTGSTYVRRATDQVQQSMQPSHVAAASQQAWLQQQQVFQQQMFYQQQLHAYQQQQQQLTYQRQLAQQQALHMQMQQQLAFQQQMLFNQQQQMAMVLAQRLEPQAPADASTPRATQSPSSANVLPALEAPEQQHQLLQQEAHQEETAAPSAGLEVPEERELAPVALPAEASKPPTDPSDGAATHGPVVSNDEALATRVASALAWSSLNVTQATTSEQLPAVARTLELLNSTIGNIAELDFETVVALVTAVLPPESRTPDLAEVERRVNLIRPTADAVQINMMSRLTPQAAPAAKPPAQPLPWEMDRRDWAAMANHLARSLKPIQHGVVVAVVHERQLKGELRFREDKFSSHAGQRFTRGADEHQSATALQREVDAADVLLLHNDMDALIVVTRPSLSLKARAHLLEKGHASAMAAMKMAEQIQVASTANTGGLTAEGAATGWAGGALSWMRENSVPERCPTHGSSHTGVTTESGVHAGQLGEEGVHGLSRKVRGGSAYVKIETKIDGALPPSTSYVRADEYRKHTSFVRDDSMKGVGRFGKISGARLAASDKTAVDESGYVQVPNARLNTYPAYNDCNQVAAMTFERTCRSAAADLACTCFSAMPGVNTLLLMQHEFAHMEEKLLAADDDVGCAFKGVFTHLFPKGSNGLMDTKDGHDDANGPAACTFWQNLGTAKSGARLEFVTVVNGHDVIVEAPMGHFFMLQAWLPHLTQASAAGPQPQPDDERVHHTAYCDLKTEYSAWVFREHRMKRRELQLTMFGQALRKRRMKRKAADVAK